MSTPLNVLLFGKIPTHLEAVPEHLQPDYQVINIASSVEEAADVLPPLISGADGKKIDLIIMGGGFNSEEYEKIVAMEGAKSVPWFRPSPDAIKAAGGKPPSAEDVAQRVRKVIDEHAEEVREGKGKGELWYF